MPVTSADKKSDRTAVESSLVPDLQRQIREREKRIAELEAQLEALKLIDQDMEKRRQFSRPPATLTPIE
jgi:TolA-binding protein